MNNLIELSHDEIEFVGGAGSDTPAYEDGKNAGEVVGQAIEDAVEYVVGFIGGMIDGFTNGK
ncbi:hypothetical protein [Altererythrobacter sp. ZODW24]|uniref:hypothetical protein n=1 Tax=Altererythrobacter sp. ZODW24 TaxID=2185142 RepID=UPI000DF7A38D|nr:hypothetical protein [Altererythrobacter sp. ZODW24]